MKLLCRACKAIVKRDKRMVKKLSTKRGYKSYCDITDKIVWLKLLER